jgi:serine/threonine protein kinase
MPFSFSWFKHNFTAGKVVKASFSDLAPELSLDSMKALQLDVSKEVKILGQFGYGKLSDVFKASLTKSGETVALKQMQKDPNEDEDPAARVYDFRREVMVMNDLKHPSTLSAGSA